MPALLADSPIRAVRSPDFGPIRRIRHLVARWRAEAAAARAARVPAMVAMALVMGGAAVPPAEAQQVGWHPAVAAGARPVAGIDPNTFIPGHPASPTVRGGHANFEHPAVLVARAAGQGGIDPNTFLVQPPASVAWIATPEQDDGRRYAQAERDRPSALR